MSRCAELLNQEAEMDFIDINIGCPIDLVFKKVFTEEFVLDICICCDTCLGSNLALKKD